MSQYRFKTTNIKGKEYVEVNERIKAFRALPEYRNFGIQTEMLHLDTESCVVRATITNETGIVVAHGMGVTPTSVQVTVTGTTPYVVTVHTIGSTNFTVRFYDMTGAAVTSTAVTATWHAKT